MSLSLNPKKQKIVLLFRPAWSCPELLQPLIRQIEARGAKVILVENPENPQNLAHIYRFNLHRVESMLSNPTFQVVGLGLSMGCYALLKIAETADARSSMKGIVLYGSPMLSRRPTFRSLMTLLRIIFTPAYWGIIKSILNAGHREDIRLSRKDVVRLLFGEDRAERKGVIDAVTKQKIPSNILAEMMMALIPRTALGMPVHVIRASKEVFHSNGGALSWLARRHWKGSDSFRILEGYHFGILADRRTASAIAEDVIGLFGN